jgi:hypothetical protein
MDRKAHKTLLPVFWGSQICANHRFFPILENRLVAPAQRGVVAVPLIAQPMCDVRQTTCLVGACGQMNKNHTLPRCGWDSEMIFSADTFVEHCFGGGLFTPFAVHGRAQACDV